MCPTQTINRVLNKEDLTVQRLYSILGVLGLSLLDLAEIASKMRGQVTEHSFEQEEYLAKHPRHLCIFEYIRDGGYSFEQIKQKYGLTQKSLEKYLQDLKEQNLVELYADGRAKPLINHIRWRRGGALRRIYGPRMAKFFHEVTHRAITREDVEDLRGTHHRGSLGIMMRPRNL